MPQRHLLTGRLGMEIHNDRVDRASQAIASQGFFNRPKGIVQGIHEETSHGVDHQDLPTAGIEETKASSGSSGRKVEGPEEPWLGIDEGKGLPLIPGVISPCDDICPSLEKIVADLARNAESPGSVLAVYHHEVEPEPAPKFGQVLQNDLAAGATHEIAAEKHTHGLSFRADDPCLGHDEIDPLIQLVMRDLWHLLLGEGNAHGQNGFTRAQGNQGPIVEAAAIA